MHQVQTCAFYFLYCRSLSSQYVASELHICSVSPADTLSDHTNVLCTQLEDNEL